MMHQETVNCPHCNAGLRLTSQVLDKVGDRIQPILPAHYPLNNPQAKRCAGSETPVGAVVVKEHTHA